jgi:hypothetical protein
MLHRPEAIKHQTSAIYQFLQYFRSALGRNRTCGQRITRLIASEGLAHISRGFSPCSPPPCPIHAQLMPNSGTLLPVRSTCLGIQILTIYPQNWETITTAKARGLTSPIWTHSQSLLSLIALTVSPAAAQPVMATDATTADHLLATVLAPRHQLTQ